MFKYVSCISAILLSVLLVGSSMAQEQPKPLPKPEKNEAPNLLTYLNFRAECGELDAVYEWMKKEFDGVPEYSSLSKQSTIQTTPVDVFLVKNDKGRWSLIVEAFHPLLGQLGCVMVHGTDWKKLSENSSKKDVKDTRSEWEKKVDEVLKKSNEKSVSF